MVVLGERSGAGWFRCGSVVAGVPIAVGAPLVAVRHKPITAKATGFQTMDFRMS